MPYPGPALPGPPGHSCPVTDVKRDAVPARMRPIEKDPSILVYRQAGSTECILLKDNGKLPLRGELKHASRHHINKQQVIVPIEHSPFEHKRPL